MAASIEVPGTSPDPKSFLEFYAALIERKFAEGSGYDISPDIIKNIIRVLKITRPGHNTKAPALLHETEMMCNAAILYYKEDKYIPYVSMLLPIAKMLRNLLRVIND